MSFQCPFMTRSLAIYCAYTIQIWVFNREKCSRRHKAQKSASCTVKACNHVCRSLHSMLQVPAQSMFSFGGSLTWRWSFWPWASKNNKFPALILNKEIRHLTFKSDSLMQAGIYVIPPEAHQPWIFKVVRRCAEIECVENLAMERVESGECRPSFSYG